MSPTNHIPSVFLGTFNSLKKSSSEKRVLTEKDFLKDSRLIFFRTTKWDPKTLCSSHDLVICPVIEYVKNKTNWKKYKNNDKKKHIKHTGIHKKDEVRYWNLKY